MPLVTRTTTGWNLFHINTLENGMKKRARKINGFCWLKSLYLFSVVYASMAIHLPNVHFRFIMNKIIHKVMCITIKWIWMEYCFRFVTLFLMYFFAIFFSRSLLLLSHSQRKVFKTARGSFWFRSFIVLPSTNPYSLNLYLSIYFDDFIWNHNDNVDETCKSFEVDSDIYGAQKSVIWNKYFRRRLCHFS